MSEVTDWWRVEVQRCKDLGEWEEAEEAEKTLKQLIKEEQEHR